MDTPRSRRALAALICVGAVAPSGDVRAENPKVNTQILRPSPHDGDLFSVRSSDIIGELRWSAGVLASYGVNPLAFIDRSGRFEPHEAIQEQLSIDLTGSLILLDRLSIGLAVPVFLLNSGQDSGFIPLDGIPGQALGDIRVAAKVGVLVREPDQDGLGLAAEVMVGFPTGTTDAFVGDGWTLTPSLIIDLRLGPVLVAANLGAHVREAARLPFQTEVGTELMWRFGVGVDAVQDVVNLMVEVFGSSANYSAENNTYIELLLGGRLAVGDTGLGLTVGGGRGLTSGYGSTKYRIVAGLSWASPKQRDRDGDGIIDELDRCVDAPEDVDGFEDLDGCPELDNDKDGIPDPADRCPLEAEDMDGFEDADGCPDGDNDGDGILDGVDTCPGDVEDMDGFQDEDGCPDRDNDQDGLLDPQDKCSDLPEDRDGFQDEDGCPDGDNDGDGILDVEDDCPNDGTNKCGVVMNACEIVITEKVFFEYDREIIKAESFPILEAVASVMLARTQILVMQVEGHTDTDGPDDYNLDLSQRRADSVSRFLVEKGVDAGRLRAKGFGETKPIATNKTPAGRATNRRVQFMILEPSQDTCR